MFDVGFTVRLTVLATEGRSTNILLNWLSDHGFDVEIVVLEDPVPYKEVLRFRLRRLGFSTVLGQLLFRLCVVPVLTRLSLRRLREIMAENDLRDEPASRFNSLRVGNINSDEAIAALKESAPDLVLVNGTRILRRTILSSVDCPFVNVHAGITPMYRGVHGGYWALWQNDAQNFGSTVHLVDDGVDTGDVIAFCYTSPKTQDNFVTYPLLQQAASFSVLMELLDGSRSLPTLAASTNDLAGARGRQWYHPTLWQYLTGLLRGIA